MQRVARICQRQLILVFWRPYHVFRTGEAKHFTFSMQIDRGEYITVCMIDYLKTGCV